MLTREQLISAILSINSTAAVEFLMNFDTIDLRRYFERLQLTREPRSGESVWVRPAGTCAFSAAA